MAPTIKLFRILKYDLFMPKQWSILCHLSCYLLQCACKKTKGGIVIVWIWKAVCKKVLTSYLVYFVHLSNKYLVVRAASRFW